MAIAEDRTKDERTKAVELALAQIEKQFGKGSIVRLGSKEALMPIAVISTGSISFDAALGVGGIPRGRVTEVFGPESSGKTTITLQIIAGYGFTAESHFLYVVNQKDGRIVQTLSLKKSPEYILKKGDSIFVRTYDTDYVFKAGNQGEPRRRLPNQMNQPNQTNAPNQMQRPRK